MGLYRGAVPRWRRPVLALAAWLLVLLVMGTLLPVGRAAAAGDPPGTASPPTSTTLPVDLYPQSVIPLPNSGHKPTQPGDPGGSQQGLLFLVLFIGSALIFGRVLWAARAHTKANRIEQTRTVRSRRSRTPRPST
jgi:hypothetical protein